MICLLAVFNLRCIKANKVVKEGPPKFAHNFCSRLDFQCCDRFFLVLRHCSGILKANTEFNKQIIARLIAVQAGEAVDNCKRFHFMLPGPIC